MGDGNHAPRPVYSGALVGWCVRCDKRAPEYRPHISTASNSIARRIRSHFGPFSPFLFRLALLIVGMPVGQNCRVVVATHYLQIVCDPLLGLEVAVREPLLRSGPRDGPLRNADRDGRELLHRTVVDGLACALYGMKPGVAQGLIHRGAATV